jgi:hypothetical protein
MTKSRVLLVLIVMGVAFSVLVKAQVDPPRDKRAHIKVLKVAGDSEATLDEIFLATDFVGHTRLVMSGPLTKARQRFFWLVDRQNGEYRIVRLTNDPMNDARRIQKIYKKLGVDVSPEHLAYNLLPESQRLKDRLREIEGRIILLGPQADARDGAAPYSPNVTPAAFVTNVGRYLFKPTVAATAQSEACDEDADATFPRRMPTATLVYNMVRAAQWQVDCSGTAWADVQTWEPAKYLFNVDQLNETYAEASYATRNGNLTYTSKYGTCWANPSTFANTTWGVDSCATTNTSSYNYFDYAKTGTYFNTDFIQQYFHASGVVVIVATAAVQYVNGGPNWGTDYYETGDNLGQYFASWFLSGIIDGAVDQDCDTVCDPSQSEVEECEIYYAGTWDWESCQCTISPILLDVDGDGFSFTSPLNGVSFDMLVKGTGVQMAWTQQGSDDAFLVLDRNGNGRIDDGSELFGTKTPQPTPSGVNRKKRRGPNGFLALAVYDDPSRGGNGDGVISEDDAIYSQLRAWTDVNHNGISESSELVPLAQHGIRAISLRYTVRKEVDQFGNRLSLWSHVVSDRDLLTTGPMKRRAVDVFLGLLQPVSQLKSPERRRTTVL